MTTIELLKMITKGRGLTHFRDPSKKEYFTLTEKQFKWVWGVFACENKNADAEIGATITAPNGDSFGLNWCDYIWNVPHYIPRREKYGRTFYIHFNPQPIAYGKIDYAQRKKEIPRG